MSGRIAQSEPVHASEPICKRHVTGLFAQELVSVDCAGGTVQRYAPFGNSPRLISPTAMFAVTRARERDTLAPSGAFSVFQPIESLSPTERAVPFRGRIKEILGAIKGASAVDMVTETGEMVTRGPLEDAGTVSFALFCEDGGVEEGYWSGHPACFRITARVRGPISPNPCATPSIS